MESFEKAEGAADEGGERSQQISRETSIDSSHPQAVSCRREDSAEARTKAASHKNITTVPSTIGDDHCARASSSSDMKISERFKRLENSWEQMSDSSNRGSPTSCYRTLFKKPCGRAPRRIERQQSDGSSSEEFDEQDFDTTAAPEAVEKSMPRERSVSGNSKEKTGNDKDELEHPESSKWCVDSEIRLFKKLITHKPAGSIAKHFQMITITDYMSNIYEDEDTDFEDYLTPESLHELYSKKNTTGKPRIFKPKYKIRPTPKEIWAKLEEMYDMKEIDENEGIPDALLIESEFSLPESEFGDLLRKKAELNKKQNFIAPQTTGNRSARRRRQESGETRSSRSSTPGSRDHRKT